MPNRRNNGWKKEMTLHIEFIYFRGCPNIEATRKNLAAACAAAHIAPVWTEWDHDDEAAPGYVRQYGSPTILVNGRDIAGGSSPCGANACRIYDGSRGVPGIGLIRESLETRELA